MTLTERIKLRLWAYERDPKAIAKAVGTSVRYVEWVRDQMHETAPE